MIPGGTYGRFQDECFYSFLFLYENGIRLVNNNFTIEISTHIIFQYHWID